MFTLYIKAPLSVGAIEWVCVTFDADERKTLVATRGRS